MNICTFLSNGIVDVARQEEVGKWENELKKKTQIFEWITKNDMMTYMHGSQYSCLVKVTHAKIIYIMYLGDGLCNHRPQRWEMPFYKLSCTFKWIKVSKLSLMILSCFLTIQRVVGFDLHFPTSLPQTRRKLKKAFGQKMVTFKLAMMASNGSFVENTQV